MYDKVTIDRILIDICSGKELIYEDYKVEKSDFFGIIKYCLDEGYLANQKEKKTPKTDKKGEIVGWDISGMRVTEKGLAHIDGRN